eukprot:TRINITY_DN14306_c1_g5_i1.p1 TRINITY_DN14306_c1_g5~~TRINITY_DN14306_c1_g5_i1.p1  ORF type:complete len:703 (-),score=98.75 TRINITY_DN14306_c1_g5_i1:137-2092(-)
MTPSDGQGLSASVAVPAGVGMRGVILEPTGSKSFDGVHPTVPKVPKPSIRGSRAGSVVMAEGNGEAVERQLVPTPPESQPAFSGGDMDEASVLDSGPSDMSSAAVKQTQDLMEHYLMGLGPLTNRVSCFFCQPKFVTPRLRDAGWAAVGHSASAFTNLNCDAVMIITMADDITKAERAVSTLAKDDSVPTLIVIVILPPRAEPDASDPANIVAIGRKLGGFRTQLFNIGADEVVALVDGKPLSPLRILEAMERCEFMVKKISEIVDNEVRAVEERSARMMQSGYRKFLMKLPGSVLENIPALDDKISESRGEDGTLSGIGAYRFTEKLGSGSFGSVFKATHPEHRNPLAVKVIVKASIKSAGSLVALDREISHLRYLETHPLVVKACDVLHTQNCISVVMSYVGQLHLHAFTKMILLRNQIPVLPVDVAGSFGRQMAAAVAHLHLNLVCHRDLKPANFIVSDDHSNLTLVDMGLSAQLGGPTHFQKQCCGSLPFCAPEVLSCKDSENKSQGYDSLASDVWSLGTNYVELVQGPYAIEKLLGWCPKPPREQKDRRLECIQQLPELWAMRRAENDETGLDNVTAHMIVLDPSARWTVMQVLGPNGFGLGPMRPPRRGYVSHVRPGGGAGASSMPEREDGSLPEGCGGGAPTYK